NKSALFNCSESDTFLMNYITKPFNPVILGAKAKALIRRNNASSAASKTIIQRGPFELDTAALKLYKDGEEIILSAKEFLVLKLFMENPGRVLTREVIYEAVWNDIIVDENTVMVYINHLRTKLEEDPKKPVYIKTVWGMGYTFSV
ncbi:MAG: winged helix-turn-helix domain-containing protein, partial [Acetivibrio ethanolgignens]